jgi:N-methylhydantoinase A/oxoprolinase/acetone carboxylase beta subunit
LASVEDPVELAALKLEAAKPWSSRPISIRRRETSSNVAEIRRRPVYFSTTGWTDCAVLERNAINPGREVRGPVVIEDRESTTVAPPGAVLRADHAGSLVMDVTEC